MLSIAVQQPPPEVESAANESASADRHVIVNQLLTFLTEKQRQDEQLIDIEPTASNSSTLRLS